MGPFLLRAGASRSIAIERGAHYNGCMPDYYLETSSPITGDTRKPPKKKKNGWLIALRIFLIALFATSITASGYLIYLKVAYPNPCYINGMSMYPTFNVDGKTKRTSADPLTGLASTGYRSLNYKDSTEYSGDIVDYGFTAGSSFKMAELTRFDIVVTYYADDLKDTSNYDYHDNIKTDSLGKEKAAKIKRLIGLPGETVQLVPNGTPMGNLYIWSFGETVATPDEAHLVTQPYTQEDYDKPIEKAYGTPFASTHHYPAMTSSGKWTLGKSGTPGTSGRNTDEYFVLGDNRASGGSDDSRAQGALPGGWISSKLIAIAGLCTVTDGSCSPIYSSIPWFPWLWTTSWKGRVQ